MGDAPIALVNQQRLQFFKEMCFTVRHISFYYVFVRSFLFEGYG